MKDYYRILEVHPEASQEVMNKAYRALVQKYHPDRFHTTRKEYATLRMQEINEAYEILSNPVARRDYDVRYRARAGKSALADKLAGNLTDKQGDWLVKVRRVAVWFLATLAVLMVLRMAGRFLLAGTLGKLVLLGLIGYLFFRLRVRRPADGG